MIQKYRAALLTIITATSLLISACSHNNAPISTQAKTKHSIEAKPDSIIEYKTIGDVSLSLHIFNPPNHVKSNKTPAIVFFHGGGWKKGDASAFYRQSAYLASRGMVAISAEYRLIKAHGPTPAECVKDAKSAMRFVRAHAEQFGIDANMLAAGGGSAGGHLAAATGTIKGFNEDSDDLSVSERPDALVLFNPAYDNSINGFGYKKVKKYWQAISPLHNLDKNTPPTVVFLGTKDTLIPVATAQHFQASMQKLGVRSELHLYKDQLHGFFNKARYYETLLAADKFLTSLGYLQGEPTLQRTDKAVSEQAQQKSLTIGLIGDSTVASTYGWGPAFSPQFNGKVKVLNYAKNGATLDSLSKNLDALIKQKPDYIVIQFGHNDMKVYDTEAYSKKLQDYVDRVTHGGSQAIVLSSVTRRNFDEKGKISPWNINDSTLSDYAQAVQAVAKGSKVPFIDLNSISIKHHNSIGPTASAAYNFSESDKTHFSKQGAKAIADIIINELKTAVPALGAYLK